MAAAATATSALTGRIVLRPGQPLPLQGGRPALAPQVLGRVVGGRHASLLPGLLGALFSVCGHVHRLTAQRAVAAALGHDEPPVEHARWSALLRAHTLRDHLLRLALELPARLPSDEALPSGWLAGAPVVAAHGGTDAALSAALPRMPAWLQQQLLGREPSDWLADWHTDARQTAVAWATTHPHPVARWHRAVAARADALCIDGHTLGLLDEADPPAALAELAGAIARDPDFALCPTWRGLPAETGPWSRRVSAAAWRAAPTLWLRLTARLADLAAVATDGAALRHGALPLGAGCGLAWSEMARGLLVHWVRLDCARGDAQTARVVDCRVVAPTEWNFHPEGALARWLRAAAPSADDARLAACALDPCVECTVDGAAADAAAPAPATAAADA
jgi:hypothetical protein